MTWHESVLSFCYTVFVWSSHLSLNLSILSLMRWFSHQVYGYRTYVVEVGYHLIDCLLSKWVVHWTVYWLIIISFAIFHIDSIAIMDSYPVVRQCEYIMIGMAWFSKTADRNSLIPSYCLKYFPSVLNQSIPF